jgi:uncharacterized OsmC-like protein
MRNRQKANDLKILRIAWQGLSDQGPHVGGSADTNKKQNQERNRAMSTTATREEKKHEIRNGVDVTALGEVLEAVQGDPAIAKFQFRAKNKWLGGGHNRSEIKGFYGACQEDSSRTEPFVLDNAEPPVLLGRDQGANPVEYVLHALAGCMTTTMVYHAAARGITIESVETELEGDLDLHGFLRLDENVRNGYENIRVNFKVKSDASPEQLADLAGMSPVFDIVSNPVPITVNLEKQ